MRVRTRRLALAEGVTAGVVFGTAAIFIRFLQDLDAFSIAFWRLVVACLVLALAQFALKKLFSFNLIKRNFKELLILSLLLGAHLILFISAVKDTTILNATLLVNTAPIFSTFISSFIYKLKPSRLAVMGLILSFAGVCVIAYAETTTASPSVSSGFSPNLRGDLEALSAALVEAFYLSYGRKVRNQMDILSIMFTIYLLTATIIGVSGSATADTILKLPTDVETIFMLVGLGVLSTAIAHTLYFSSLSNLKSFETATMALLEPIGATLLGIIIFQEIPAHLFIFGAALVLLGILFIIKEKG